jgi:pilus assembly protein Flp/PilA
MRSFLKSLVRFFKADDGPTAVEYAMLLMLVFLACITAVVLLGQSTNRSLDHSGSQMQAAMNGGH